MPRDPGHTAWAGHNPTAHRARLGLGLHRDAESGLLRTGRETLFVRRGGRCACVFYRSAVAEAAVVPMGGFAEVPLETHGEARVVAVDGASERRRACETASAAGGASLRAGRGDPKRGVLTWSITNDDGSAITLAETWITETSARDDVQDGTNKMPHAHCVRLVFPRALLPMAAVVVESHGSYDSEVAAVVVVLDVTGVAHQIKVPSFSAATRRRAGVGTGRDAALVALSASDVTSKDMSASIAQLEGPTAMCAVGTRCVAIGGQSGRVAVLDSQSLDLAAELKPATLARLWNAMAGPTQPGGNSRLAIRGVKMIPRETRESPILLAVLREDCHVQVWDLTAPQRPVAILGASLPTAVAVFGGLAEGGGDTLSGTRVACVMHVADGFLAVATRNAEDTAPCDSGKSKNNPPITSKLSVYRLELVSGASGTGAGNGHSVKFVSSVDVAGGVASIAVCDGALWSLGSDGAVRAWPMDALVSGTAILSNSESGGPPLFGLDAHADALQAWDPRDPARGSGAAFALLGAGAKSGDEKRAPRAADVASDLTNEIAARGLVDGVALRDALASLRWPRTSATPKGGVLLAATRAVIDAAGGPDASAANAVNAWASLAPAYGVAWRSRNASVGLICADVGGGDVTIVVRGGGVGVARPLDDVEAFVQQACAGFELPPDSSPAQRAISIGATLDMLLGPPASRALDLVAAGFGSARDDDDDDETFSDVVAAVSGAAEDWLDVATAYAFGRVSPAPIAGIHDAARAALATRRASQRRAASATRLAVARLREVGASVAAACTGALDAVEWVERNEGTEGTGLPTETETPRHTRWTPRAETQSARQHADARARATRAILLLLGATRRLGSQIGATAAEVTDAACLIPRAVAAHRAALLARWLVSTPCAGAAAVAAAPDAPPPLAAAVAGWTADHHGVLPGPVSTGPTAALANVGRLKTTVLVLGGCDFRAKLDSQFEGAYVRAVEIGAELYANGELDALGALVAATRGASPGDPLDPAFCAPGLSFLRALRASASIATCENGEASPESSHSKSATRRALGFFHAAAVGVGVSDTDTDSDGGGKEHASPTDPALAHLVELLRSIMSGFPLAGVGTSHSTRDTGNLTTSTATRLTRSEYYETLMLFFERLGSPFGAAECAHAALMEVANDFSSGGGDADAMEADAETPVTRDDDAQASRDADAQATRHADNQTQAQTSDRRSARLWANLLQYALDLQKWAEAYSATLSMPGVEASRAALRRVVAAALAADAADGAEALASLPLHGDRLSSVCKALEGKAHVMPDDFDGYSVGSISSSTNTGPSNPRLVLYALFTARGAMKDAARASLGESRRLERVVFQRFVSAENAFIADVNDDVVSDDTEVVHVATALAVSFEQLVGSWLVTLNAMTLCDSGTRFAREGNGTANTNVMDADTDSGSGEEDVFDAAGGVDGTNLTKRRRRKGPEKDATTIGEVRRQYVLSAARLELLVAGASPGELCFTDSFDETQVTNLVTALVTHARFGSATAVAVSWAEGERLTKLLCLVAATLAARAALAQTKRSGKNLSSRDFRETLNSYETTSFVDVTKLGVLATGGGVLGPSDVAPEQFVDPDAAWQNLRLFLEKHDGETRNHKLSEIAARTAFAASATIRIPQWLIARFTGGSEPHGTLSQGMAHCGKNPTALLNAYVSYDRLEDAARLAIREVAYFKDAPATERTKCAVSWFPEPVLVDLCERVGGVPELAGLAEALTRVMGHRKRMAEADGAKLVEMM